MTQSFQICWAVCYDWERPENQNAGTDSIGSVSLSQRRHFRMQDVEWKFNPENDSVVKVEKK